MESREQTQQGEGLGRRGGPRRGALAALAAVALTGLLGATPGVYFTTCDSSSSSGGTFELLPVGVSPSSLLFNDFTALAGALVLPTGLALDPLNERAYIALSDGGPPYSGGIWAFGLDGRFLGVVLEPSDLGATELDVVGVAIDVGAQQLYASLASPSLGAHQIVRVDLNTGSPTTILPSLSNPVEVELSSTAVYWTEYSASPSGAVKRANLDGTDVQTLVTGLSYASGLALDLVAGKMYFSDDDGLYRANLNGSSQETLLPSISSVFAAMIDVDPDGTLYWSDGVDEIYASDLDVTSYAPIHATAFASAGVRVLLPACRDGYDNDGDGRIDAVEDDPGCASPKSVRENPQCQDGIDNDAQAGIDFDGGASLDLDHNGFIDAQFNWATPAVGAADPDCAGRPWSSRERPRAGCGLGFELVFLAPLLARLTRRRRA